MNTASSRAGAARALVLLLALLVVLPLFFRPPIVETDLWWHLATGREILARGAVPTTDPFSFTFAGREWISHEWLWDVVAWLAYEFRPDAVVAFNVAVLLALFATAFAAGRTLGAPPAACAVATITAAIGAHWFFSIRPELFSTLFVGLVLLTRDRRWAPLLWPGLIVVWVNLHGGFIVGIGAVGLLVLLRTLQASLAARRPVIDRAAWIALGLCLVVWMLNPWGWRIMGYPLDYLGSTAYREIGEWHAPDIGFDPRSYEGQFWLAAVAAVLGGARVWRRDPYPPALAAVTLAMAATSRRFIPLFLLTSAPLVAAFAAEVGERLRERWPALRSRVVAFVTAAAALGLAASLWSGVRIEPDALGRWTGIDRFPRSGLRYLRALGPPPRVLNAYDWGGYLMLHAPESKVFFDSRANTLYDEAILRDYNALADGSADVAALTARYAPDVALVPPGPMAEALQSAEPAWNAVYDDGTAVVLLPPGSPLLEDPPRAEVLLPEEAGTAMILAGQARNDGELDAAARELRRAIEREPLLVRAYFELARVELARGEIVAAGRTIEQGIAAYPRQRRRLRFYEAQAYIESGHYPLALSALRRAYPRGPFGPREFIAGLIRRVEVEILRGGRVPK